MPDVLAVVDHLPAMVAFWDGDLRNRFANQAYVEWFGREPEAMRGMHIRDLLGERVYALNRPYIEGALAGRPQLFERTLIDAAGRTRYTQASYIPNVVNDVPQGFFVLVTDITERVRAEDELRASREELARAQERARLAEDLHDVVIQRLYAVGLGMRNVLLSDPEAAARLGFVLDGIDEVITQLRGQIRNLQREARPQTIPDWLERRTEEVERMVGFPPVVSCVGPLDEVPPDLVDDAVAVLNEALSNAVRHARAANIAVTVASRGGRLELIVADDGCGFPEGVRTSGVGNMRRRAERRCGQFSIVSDGSGGTVVRWSAPLPPLPADPPDESPDVPPDVLPPLPAAGVPAQRSS